MELIKQCYYIMTPQSVIANYSLCLEEIARVCYNSQDKMTYNKDDADKFVRKLIISGHESILEHAHLTIKFNIDRAVANAIVRHRHCAFAQESTHYINYSKKGDDLTFIEQEEVIDAAGFAAALQKIEDLYYELAKTEKGKVARAILPLSFKTTLVVTTSLREWRTILKIRTITYEHPQTRKLMLTLLTWFKNNLPIFVEDIENE